MIMWQAGDLAVAVRTAHCGCGLHKIERRKTYRVRHVGRGFLGEEDMIFLDVSPTQDEHYYPHDWFRREQKADRDIFKLADAPVPRPRVRELEPTH
jgi:hypothetical protein